MANSEYAVLPTPFNVAAPSATAIVSGCKDVLACTPVEDLCSVTFDFGQGTTTAEGICKTV